MEAAIDSGIERAAAERRTAVAMAHDGARVLVGDGQVVRFADGRVLLHERAAAIALVEGEAWLVIEDGGEHALHRFDGAGARIGAPLPLGRLGAGVQLTATRVGVRSALIEGERAVYVREQAVEELGGRGRDRRVLAGGRGVLERRGGALVFRRGGGSIPLPADLAMAAVVGGAMVLDGGALLVELESAGRRTAVVFDIRRGAVRTRIRLGDAGILAIAERKGLIVLGRGAHVALCDLRAGRCVGERILPAPAVGCAIDADGTKLVAVDATGRTYALAASMADFGAHAVEAQEESAELEAVPATEELAPAPADIATAVPTTELTSGCSVHESNPVEIAEIAEIAAPAEIAPLPASPADDLASLEALILRALGPAPERELTPAALEEYLADARAWIVALCRTALATAIDTGRLGRADAAAPVAELEAMLGELRGRATESVARALEREGDAVERFARWNRRGAPHVELARELGLSPLASSLLWLVAAPQIWGELARAYGACVGDSARPLVDELLLAHLLDADAGGRAAIGRELDEDAPLVASGAVAVARGLRPYAGLAAHPAIARRLAGAPPAADLDDGTPPADRALSAIIGPRAAIAAAARRLADRATSPVRVVVRGRAAMGRRTTAAALAARAGRRIGLVAIEPAASDVDARLAQRLRDVALRGDLPCVSLDGLAEDPALRARLRTVLDRHAGPLFVRAPRGGDLPLAPGYLAIDFAALSETERRAAWQSTLAARGLDPAPAGSLAARFQVGPGAMARACTAAAAALAAAPSPSSDAPSPSSALEAALADALRQHRSARIEAVATRVERLASWDDLIVPDDIADALHELCARVRHRRTVLEDWGMRGVAATAQGVTALFQGAPGTGKTMAAEVIANALGYELWRVDLSKVVSKWIGETEKNLAAVFDAAEDGEIVLLFDEADSLFGKRTEVKSSHDRNANLETNYLLQRLDAFTGIAILTTNFGTAIDPAFRRRLSVQAQFALPDEQDRERLWRAFLPRTLPVAAGLDLSELARRYPLTGGYIRNAVLRAAYVAAGRGTPLASADLERAVRAEYLARGKVSDTGVIA